MGKIPPPGSRRRPRRTLGVRPETGAIRRLFFRLPRLASRCPRKLLRKSRIRQNRLRQRGSVAAGLRAAMSAQPAPAGRMRLHLPRSLPLPRSTKRASRYRPRHRFHPRFARSHPCRLRKKRWMIAFLGRNAGQSRLRSGHQRPASGRETGQAQQESGQSQANGQQAQADHCRCPRLYRHRGRSKASHTRGFNWPPARTLLFHPRSGQETWPSRALRRARYPSRRPVQAQPRPINDHPPTKNSERRQVLSTASSRRIRRRFCTPHPIGSRWEFRTRISAGSKCTHMPVPGR